MAEQFKEQQERTQQEQREYQEQLWMKVQERKDQQLQQVEQRFAGLQGQLQTVHEGSESLRRGVAEVTTRLDQRQTKVEEEQAKIKKEQIRFGQHLDVVQETAHREVVELDNKVSRAMQEVSDRAGRAEHVVSNISDRVKAIENCLAGNVQPVLLGVSGVPDECPKRGGGNLSPSAAEFTPVKGATSAVSGVVMPVRRKPQEFDGKVC